MNENLCPANDGHRLPRLATSVCVDWYSEGETRVVDVDGMRVAVRFVGRKGRRGRIVIEAPAGAIFSSFSTGAEQPTLTSDSGARRSM
jgi:hypothetical protein